MTRPGPSAFSDPHSDPSGQFGALCWRKNRGKVQVLLITSRDTGRWIVPKGWPHPSRSPAGSAAAEAWEEAGVEGKVCETPVGLFSYDKVLKPGVVQPCIVTVFALRVAKLRSKFPEHAERRRKWFDASRAARKVIEPELRMLLAAIAEDAGLLEPPAAEGHATAPT